MEWEEMTFEGSGLGPGKISWIPSGCLGSNAPTCWKPLLDGNDGSPPSHRHRTACFTSVF